MSMTLDQSHPNTTERLYKNDEGNFSVVLHKREFNKENKNNDMYHWLTEDYIDRYIDEIWCVDTYFTDEKDHCFGYYNPTQKPDPDNPEHRNVINFDWMLEATEENAQKILDECERMYKEDIKEYPVDKSQSSLNKQLSKGQATLTLSYESALRGFSGCDVVIGRGLNGKHKLMAKDGDGVFVDIAKDGDEIPFTQTGENTYEISLCGHTFTLQKENFDLVCAIKEEGLEVYDEGYPERFTYFDRLEQAEATLHDMARDIEDEGHAITWASVPSSEAVALDFLAKGAPTLAEAINFNDDGSITFTDALPNAFRDYIKEQDTKPAWKARKLNDPSIKEPFRNSKETELEFRAFIPETPSKSSLSDDLSHTEAMTRSTKAKEVGVKNKSH